MWVYGTRRLAQTLLVVFGVSLVVFFLLHTSADIAASMLSDWATEEQVALFRERMGFNQPLYVQYFRWAQGVIQGDFGVSWRHGCSAMGLVLARMPYTIQLGLVAEVISVVVGLPLGVAAALYRGSLWDRISMTVALIGQSAASFWLGLMLMWVFAVGLGLLPVSGTGSLAHLLLPAVTLASRPMARLARVTRSGMLEVLGAEYITTARSKGLAERVVVFRHALKNAMLPIVTIVGLELGTLLNGSVVVESVFAWPGVGQLVVQALQARDIPLVQASVMVIATMYVVVNLIVDMSYAWLDPRVRF